MAVNNTNANRQRMINLMYIVFIAMMALNVSSEVLDGFVKVDKSLLESIDYSRQQNEILLSQIESIYKVNPEKSANSYKASQDIHHQSLELNRFIDSLKQAIADKTDGKGADPNNISRKDHLEASGIIMLDPITGKGKVLKNKIELYKSKAHKYYDSYDNKTFDRIINTSDVNGNSWEADNFENMPSVAAITILSKMQSDISNIESLVLSNLIESIDKGDYRVNQITAKVIPNSKVVLKGQKYSADIILASIDTTSKPNLYINNKKIDNENGRYEFTTNSIGNFSLSGYIETKNRDGSVNKHPFNTEYTVVEPMASISPSMLNVLYIGIDNPIKIAAAGIPSDRLSVSISNGTLQKKGNDWIARVPQTAKEVSISVSYRSEDGSISTLGSSIFKAKTLPDPMPYILISDKSGQKRLKNGKISKQSLLASNKIYAAIDDNILDIAFSVKSFAITSFDSMGNAILEQSNGNEFSQRQIRQINSMRRGTRLYITDIQAIGPDGVQRKISPMEIILN